MSIQEQNRRELSTDNATFTGAEGEVIYTTDDKRLHVHDGLTAGGMTLPNALDILKNTLTDATATGTDDYEITLPYFPTTYSAGLRINVTFTNANTDAVTLDTNGLGVKDVKNADGDALVLGDIEAGSSKWLEYNGTEWRFYNGFGNGSGNGTHVLLAEVEISSDSAVVFDSTILNGDYDKYVVDYMDVKVPDGSAFAFQFSDDNGATYETSFYQLHCNVYYNVSGQSGYNSGTVTSGYLSAAGIGTSGVGENGITGTLELPKIHDADNLYKLLPVKSVYTRTDGNLENIYGSVYVGGNADNNSVNNIKFFPTSGGTMASGIIKIYGVL